MPPAFKCSDCGGLIEGEPSATMATDRIDETIEMCESCLEGLVAQLDGHEVMNLNDYEQKEVSAQ